MATDFGEESLSSQARKFECRPSVASNIVVRIVILCSPAAIRSPKEVRAKASGLARNLVQCA